MVRSPESPAGVIPPARRSRHPAPAPGPLAEPGADFGHTDPQYVIPSGGEVTVDGSSQQIHVTY